MLYDCELRAADCKDEDDLRSALRRHLDSRRPVFGETADGQRIRLTVASTEFETYLLCGFREDELRPFNS